MKNELVRIHPNTTLRTEEICLAIIRFLLQSMNQDFNPRRLERCLGRCRFSDCTHTREPGCAVRAALAAGELDPARWESWRKLKREAELPEELSRRKREWSKAVARANKQRKKESRRSGDRED